MDISIISPFFSIVRMVQWQNYWQPGCAHNTHSLTTILPSVAHQAAEHLQSFIADCDRRTELAKKRLAETQDEISAEVAAKVTFPSTDHTLTAVFI